MDTNDVNPQDEVKPVKHEIDAGEGILADLIRQQELDMKALQTEFNTVNDETNPDAIRKALVAAAPNAIREIITLSTMADSESVRANTCKYILDVGLGKNAIGDPTAEGLNKLLEELKGNNKKKKTSEKETTEG